MELHGRKGSGEGVGEEEGRGGGQGAGTDKVISRKNNPEMECFPLLLAGGVRHEQHRRPPVNIFKNNVLVSLIDFIFFWNAPESQRRFPS